MNEKIITPCNNVCRYEKIDGEPTCVSCFRTYEDLDKWSELDNEARRRRIKQCKARKKKYLHGRKDI